MSENTQNSSRQYVRTRVRYLSLLRLQIGLRGGTRRRNDLYDYFKGIKE